MNDLISRQAAFEALNGEIEIAGRANVEAVKGYVRLVKDRLERLPSAQPEIIRCKDCKHFAGEWMYCACDIIVQFDHFYCYHAERRQDV